MSSNPNQQFVSPHAAGQAGRRSKMETCGDILRAIAAGAQKPTHIMYRANLSWNIMQGYISGLEAQGYVVSTIESERKVYKLSQRGFEILNRMQQVKQELGFAAEE